MCIPRLILSGGPKTDKAASRDTKEINPSLVANDQGERDRRDDDIWHPEADNDPRLE